MKNIIGRMSVYNVNITGLNTYFYRGRKELKALIEQEDLQTIWFDFRTTDNHWAELIKALNVDCNS